MTKENTSSKPKRIFRTIFKIGTIGAALVLAILVSAHFAWKYSGSNQWEQVIDGNGVKVYTLKAPGDVVKRIRGVTQARTTLNAAVDSMMQTGSKDCSSWFPSCVSVQAVKPWSTEDLTYIHLFRIKGRPPFAPREVLIKGQATQDPVTKTVTIEFTGMPDALPANECCYRVAHMQNTWHFTPLENGLVEVENRMNVDMGLPYFMFNRVVPRAQHRLLSKMQKHLDNERWQQVRYEQIKERS